MSLFFLTSLAKYRFFQRAGLNQFAYRMSADEDEDYNHGFDFRDLMERVIDILE